MCSPGALCELQWLHILISPFVKGGFIIFMQSMFTSLQIRLVPYDFPSNKIQKIFKNELLEKVMKSVSLDSKNIIKTAAHAVKT